MSRTNISYEKKYRYLLYRIQQALAEMNTAKTHVGRRHLENGLYACTGWQDSAGKLVSHEEMTLIKEELFKDE